MKLGDQWNINFPSKIHADYSQSSVWLQIPVLYSIFSRDRVGVDQLVVLLLNLLEFRSYICFLPILRSLCWLPWASLRILECISPGPIGLCTSRFEAFPNFDPGARGHKVSIFCHHGSFSVCPSPSTSEDWRFTCRISEKIWSFSSPLTLYLHSAYKNPTKAPLLCRLTTSTAPGRWGRPLFSSSFARDPRHSQM